MSGLPTTITRPNHVRDGSGREVHFTIELPDARLRRHGQRDSPRRGRRRLKREVRAALALCLIVTITSAALTALIQQRSLLETKDGFGGTTGTARVAPEADEKGPWAVSLSEPHEEPGAVPVLARPTGILLPDEGS